MQANEIQTRKKNRTKIQDPEPWKTKGLNPSKIPWKTHPEWYLPKTYQIIFLPPQAGGFFLAAHHIKKT